MKNNKVKLLLSVGVVFLCVAIPFGLYYLFNRANTIVDKDITNVAVAFVKEATTIGDPSSTTAEEVKNRFEQNLSNRNISVARALEYVSSNSKTLNEKGLKNINTDSSYSGALVRQENLDTYITNVKVEKNVATVSFNLKVKEYITYINPDETGVDKSDLDKVIKTKKKVFTATREVEIKGLQVKLTKIDDEWKVSDSVNLEEKGAQYFSTWKGTSKSITPDTQLKIDESRTIEIEET